MCSRERSALILFILIVIVIPIVPLTFLEGRAKKNVRWG
jgi:hypothetical protein